MENKKDEVYVSYNGEDSSFISHLIAEFDRKGIAAFFEAAGREMEEKRFSKLKVFVVVFSQNFLPHLPLLERRIYSCRKNEDFVMVPVFYRVSKSSVNQDMEKFGGAYEVVQRWMPKLQRGHEYDCKQSETDFVEEIARVVFEILYPTEEIGIQSPLDEIENLLCKQPWGVRTLGIFGGHGIGKKTLAKAFFRQISRGYDKSRFIKDFHTKYYKNILESLLPEYFSKTRMEMFDQNISESKPCYRKKRVLVCLDDVRDAQEAKTFLGGFDKYGPGSLIMITSRERNVLKECGMKEIYELKGLNDVNALKLFTRCAFGKDVIEENLLDHSKKAIECCGGNPSAIRSKAKEFKGMAAVDMEPESPDVRQVFSTGHHLSCNIADDTYMCTSYYEKDKKVQENEEFQSDHNAVSATNDTKVPTSVKEFAELQIYLKKEPGLELYNPISKSLSRYRSFNRIYFTTGKACIEFIRRNHSYFQQGIATQLQKILQNISITRDGIDQPMLMDLNQPVMFDSFDLPPAGIIIRGSKERQSTGKGIYIGQIDYVN